MAELLKKMLKYDTKERISWQDLHKHKFFHDE